MNELIFRIFVSVFSVPLWFRFKLFDSPAASSSRSRTASSLACRSGKGPCSEWQYLCDLERRPVRARTSTG